MKIGCFFFNFYYFFIIKLRRARTDEQRETENWYKNPILEFHTEIGFAEWFAFSLSAIHPFSGIPEIWSPMRSLKAPFSNNGTSARRLTFLHLVCAAALFSFLVFVIQSSFFAGFSSHSSLCLLLPFISFIISFMFFSFLPQILRLSAAYCRS